MVSRSGTVWSRSRTNKDIGTKGPSTDRTPTDRTPTPPLVLYTLSFLLILTFRDLSRNSRPVPVQGGLRFPEGLFRLEDVMRFP